MISLSVSQLTIGGPGPARFACEAERADMNSEQLKKAQSGAGFIAALDQSGGSTPKALKLYGIPEDAYSGDDQMFDLVHEMRTRIITSPAFDGDRIMGAILFEMTMDREIEGRPTADYLWNVKNIVPFLKIDKGLAEEKDGAQMMKPMPGLDELLDRAVANGVFGTKERSVIKLPGAGLEAVVAQQFDVARQVLAKGLVPIIEPEVDIKSPKKGEAEELLKAALLKGLDELDDDQKVMLKLTLPDTDPPRRQTRSSSPAARTWSGVNITPNDESTTSNDSSAKGSASASASWKRTGSRSASARRRACSRSDAT